MIVRFGFVAMSLELENASPSKTMTYATFSKLNDREAGIHKLERIAGENLGNSLRLLKHCHFNDIQLYRFSSKLIPLATHEALADRDSIAELAPQFSELGKYARQHNIRVSFHPDHFCVFSTPRPEVLVKSKLDLEYHVRMLEAMGLDEATKCNIHIGGAYGDKVSAGERFVRQFGALSPRFKHRVTLENDDKTFNARETLEAAEQVGVPMVLDIHHHAVNPGDISEQELYQGLWPRINQTWELERERLGMTEARQLPPKIHASSPKSPTDPRGHADYVEAEPLVRFLREAARTSEHVDCMLEAKKKDEALFKLMADLTELAHTDENIRIIDRASVEVFP
jgi:UV DNA damage endonuclease